MAQTPTATPLYKTTKALLADRGIDLDAFIAERREGGESYETIARLLFAETGGVVDLSFRTLARWMEPEEVAS